MAFSSGIKSNQDEDLKRVYAEGGIDAVLTKTDEYLGKWKTIALKVAIIGRTGVGKSSLINAWVDLGPLDPGAAEIGIVETTSKVQPYPHPVNPNLVFYDLPGAGTEKFPRSTYLTCKDIGFANYDVFVIVTADRFTEDDVWLGREIANQKKSFVFVRSKIDIDIMNEKKTKRIPEQQTIATIRKDCEKILKADEHARVFLVDSYDTNKFDFDGLNSHLIASVPEWKKAAFVLAMSTTTASLIDEKEKVLTERIYKIALISAIGGAIPVPGLSMAIDAGIILKEIQFYRTQYGIPQAMQYVMKNTKLSTPAALIEILKLSDFSSASMTAAVLVSKIPSLVVSEALERSATMLIPILGSIIGGAISYGSTVYALKQILAKVTKDAHSISKYRQEQTSV